VWLFSFFVSLTARFLSRSDLLVVVAGARVIRAGMTTKLTDAKQEWNTTLLKVIEKDGAIGRLSEQLQSKCQILALSSSFPRTLITCRFDRLSEVNTELKQSQMAREHDVAALNQARDAQRKSEAISQNVIEDIANLGRVMSAAMAGLGVSLGPITLETLIEEVGRLPGVVRELELTTVR
jgi:hypothetical protein